MIEDIDRDVSVRIQTDLLVVGDSIMTDRHHASNGNYEDDDPQNQIGGIIPAFSLSGWLRHGMEKVIQERGGTACHPGEPNANFRKDGVYNRDLDAGYHEKGACLDDDDDNGCVILDLFGGFGNRPGKVMRRPIQFSPVRSSVDYTRGQPKATTAESTGTLSPGTRKTTASRSGTPNWTLSGISTAAGTSPSGRPRPGMAVDHSNDAPQLRLWDERLPVIPDTDPVDGRDPRDNSDPDDNPTRHARTTSVDLRRLSGRDAGRNAFDW